MVVLFDKKENCCGCGACRSVCPVSAIAMQKDEHGFVYPVIDADKCIECGKCVKTCRFVKAEKTETSAVYAAITKDRKAILNSSSGGIFSVLADKVLSMKGVVYGSAMLEENNRLYAKHIRVDNPSQFPLLQGSKYLQSDIGDTYIEAKKDLEAGRTVLFSGTPCQIDGLKGYLGKDYDGLWTVDIICHGVPNNDFFNAYIELLNKKYGGNVRNFIFRDKTAGWGLNAKYVYADKKGNIKEKRMPAQVSSYYDMFLKGQIYRENCYVCPYACAERVGDITLGDYWGIQRVHPEQMVEAGGFFRESDGVSCVLVNTEKGATIVADTIDHMALSASNFENAAKENGQLKAPTKKPAARETILNLYKEQGYEAVDRRFRKAQGIKLYYRYAKAKFPRSLKQVLKKALRKR